ncbi:TonB-dependent receptor [Kineobactrum sediminis]|uniref:TonB-dependent receptor n=1 Tax=Kineobactrum sediminis TaxID=1905677 RepID=A0A2N5Y569_9GAMM|nr:TonB-dependent receptor [Kineobactrum sediminis]PLW83537.1 TonB-dependent receptor [Kineobactrum sediminis]
MLAESRATRYFAQGVVWALLLLACARPMAQTGTATNPAASPTYFAIEEGSLAAALIAFSRQSDTPIVFSDRLIRHLRAPAITGNLDRVSALNRLLEATDLDWEFIDQRIVAIYSRNCDDDSCDTPEETGTRFPVYQPGIEETYVYGSHLTGSRIRRDPGRYSAPIDVYARSDIERSGAQTIGELLKFVPAVIGNSTSTAIANGGDGTATVTLRGLPASNTLILINGRRVANNGLAGESVDLNSISPAAVERVEILKDGASAIYGSDAIAGVVNIIMKRDFYGVLAESFYGESSRGDMTTTTQTLQYGTGFRDGGLFVSASYYEQEPLFSRDRKVSRSADTRPLGGSDQRSSATPDARIVLPNGQAVIADGSGYRPATSDDLFDYQAFTTAVVPMRRSNVYASLSHDLNEQVTTLLELNYLETSATATLAPTPVFTAFEQTPLTLAADNVFNDFGVELTDIRRRLVEFPPRQQRNQSEVARVSAIVEGLYADWYWDVGYNWSRSQATESVTNVVNANHLRRALGSPDQCRGMAVDGCVPVDLAGPAGSINQQQIDYLRVDGEVSGEFTLSSLSLNLSNALLNLPAGRGDLALGLEFRHEDTSKRPDALLAATGTIGATNFEATRGDRKIIELYAETRIPLWQSATGGRGLELEAALRQSSYSDFGAATNPKIGLKLQLGPSLVLRGGYARGFRAPSLNELYEGASEEQAFIDDPCTRTTNVDELPGCSQQADPTRNQFLVVKGGNPDLEAVTSHSFSGGLVWTPEAAPGLRLSLDYFQIDQKNVIASSAQFIVDRNARDDSFSDNVIRDEQGNLVRVEANNLNIGKRRVQGADLGIAYHFPRQRWGQLSITGSGAYIREYLTQVDADAPRVDLAGTFQDEASEGLGGIPEWKSQLGLRWKRERWNASYDIHHVSAMREQVPGTDRTRTISSWTVHDLQLSYNFDVLEGLRLTLGLDNALDEPAPLAASAFNDNIDARTHELKGRFWYTRLSQRF